MVERLPYDHVYRNPNYKPEELKVKESTGKGNISHPSQNLTIGFRGKSLTVEASIPQKWFKAGDSIPVKLVLIPNGYKNVSHVQVRV